MVYLSYKDPLPMVPQQNSVFFVQETDHIYSIAFQGLHTVSLAKSVPDGLKP
jgi:hypothetical protein